MIGLIYRGTSLGGYRTDKEVGAGAEEHDRQIQDSAQPLEAGGNLQFHIFCARPLEGVGGRGRAADADLQDMAPWGGFQDHLFVGMEGGHGATVQQDPVRAVRIRKVGGAGEGQCPRP